MSAKKISHIFNRVATHGATALLALALSVGGGIYSYNQADTRHDAVAPVTSVEQSATAEQTLRAQGAEIMREQVRLDFTATSLQKMQDNLGTNGSSVKSQLQDLADARAVYDRDVEAQTRRLGEYRRSLWLNPAISEQQADKIYTDLFYAAQDKGLHTINNFLAPMTDALTLRDETIQSLHMTMDEKTATLADVQKLVEAARAADSAHDNAELGTGIMMGLLDAAVLFSWMGVGLIGRRKEEREAAEEQAEREGRQRIAEDFSENLRKAEALARQNAAPAETAAPAKKSAQTGKFTV